MSTPATRTTDRSAGGSTKGAHNVRLTSGGTVGGGSGTATAGTVLLVAGSHVSTLHLTELLPSLTVDIPKFLQGVNFEDQPSQGTEIYELLNTSSPSLPRLN